MPNNTTNNNVDPIISAINALSDSDRQALTEKVRTTPSGISAFKAFNYGAGETTSSSSTSTGSGSTGTGTSGSGTGTTGETSSENTEEAVQTELPPLE